MKKVSISEIINFLRQNGSNVTFKGDERDEVEGFSSFSNYKKGTLTWVKNPKDINWEEVDCDIRLVVTEKDSGLKVKNLIEAENSKAIFFGILGHFWGESEEKNISPNSVILSNKIGHNVGIGHHCYIGEEVIIGDNVKIGNNVQIECPCSIGEGTTIASGVVIGTDGFGYYQDENGNNVKVRHFGGVKIGKNVEIGANVCIDRGTIDDTCIGDNVKMNNLCHVGHNTKIGDNSLVTAGCTVCGSVTIEKNVYVAPGSIIRNQLHIGADAFVGMGAVVTKDVPDNKVVVGAPAKIIRDNK